MAISARTRFKVLIRDEFTCRYCGKRGNQSQLHVDHVRPVSAGGSDAIDNLVTACVDCNLGKGALRGVSAPGATLSQSVVGRFFHSLNAEGNIEWQGQITGWDESVQRFVCTRYSWLDGSSTGDVLATLDDVSSFRLYQSDRLMRRMYAQASGMSKDDFEYQERVIAHLNGAA